MEFKQAGTFVTGIQNKLQLQPPVASTVTLTSENDSTTSAESLATVSNYDASSLLFKLQQRGVNPLRPEVIAIIEFLPLAINNEDSQNDYQNLNFGSDAIVSSASNAALFAEVQRILKETSYSGIVSLIEKESGMKLALMKLIIEYFIAILNRAVSTSTNTSDKLRKIFKEDNSLDECARQLVLAIINNDINLTTSILSLENTNIQTPEYRNPENFSIDDKLNFGQDISLLAQNETLSLKSFITSNSTNNRIILLARCAILQAVSAGVIKNIKNNTKIVDDFIKAVYLGEIVNPELEIDNSNFFAGEGGSFLNEHSYDLSSNPLEKIGITLEATTYEGDADEGTSSSSTGTSHSLSFSNNFIFLNVIGSLICELLFFNNKDETQHHIKINNEANKGNIVIGRNSDFVTLIKNLTNKSHTMLLSPGNRYDTSITGNTLGSIQELFDDAAEIFSFCIFNEVVGDNIYLKNIDVLKNYKDDISFNSNDYSEKILAELINNVLIRVNSNSSRYPDFINRIEDFSSVENFSDISNNHTLGSFVNFLISYRNERNTITNQDTGNKYLFLETSKGIYDFSIGSENNLVPVEDALFNNIINDPGFNSEDPLSHLFNAPNIAGQYIGNVSNLAEDIIRLFGIGYDKDEGTITEIANDSKGSKILNKGVTPLNYLNYFLEGIAEDLEALREDVFRGFGDLTNDDVMATDEELKYRRGAIISLALILAASTEEDYLNLFKGFYFNDKAIENNLRLPLINYPAETDFELIRDQYRLNATAATEAQLIKLLEENLDEKAQKVTKTFVGGGTWESMLYRGNPIGSDDNIHDHNSTKTGKYKTIDLGKELDVSNYYIGSDTTNEGFRTILMSDQWGTGHKTVLAHAMSSHYHDGDNAYDSSKPRAAISIGSSFFKRLVTSPILYSSIQNSVASDCVSAINNQNKSSSDFKNKRFKNNKYYKASGAEDILEKDTNLDNADESFVMGGINRLTHIQKGLAIFTWYVKFLQNTIGLKLRFGSDQKPGAFGTGWPVHKLEVSVNENIFLGVAAALRGESIGEFENIPAAIAAYDNANEYLAEIRGIIKRKKKQTITKLNILAKNALDIKKESLDIIASFSEYSWSQTVSFDKYVRKYFSNYSNKFIISRDAGGNATKYYYDHLAYEKNSFPLAKYDKKDIKEYKRMYQVLSTQNFNLLANEKLGRKNILNVGIPAGLVDTLAQQAYSNSGDDQFLDSSLIAIYLHRKNELTEEEEVFPRPYVFDTAKYISNINSPGSKLIPDIEYLNELSNDNFFDNQQLGAIALAKTSYLLSDRNQPNSANLSFVDNGEGAGSMEYNFVEGQAEIGSNYSGNFREDVCFNHIMDHNLKLYQNLMLDLEFEDYNFLLEKENLYVEGADDSQIVSSRRDSFRNFLFAYFPSFNVDEQTRLRVSKAILNYDNLLFNNIDKKLRQITSGLIFDRVFSIPFSDRDFVLKTELDYGDIYGTEVPTIRASSRNYVSNVTEVNDNSKKLEKNYVNKIKNNESGTIYKFFVTVNILKRW